MVAPKLLFVVTDDAAFCSHFMERARAAASVGFDVAVATPFGSHVAEIVAAGFRAINLTLDRRSLSPVSALRTLRQLVAIYRQERPTIIHHVALKPILLGSIAGRIVGGRSTINSVIGLGYAFTSRRLLMRLVSQAVKVALRASIPTSRSRVVFENAEDLQAFVEWRIVSPDNAVLIRGCGVALPRQQSYTSMASAPIVLLAARWLWDKGIGEYVEASRLLKQRGVPARFVLLGRPDPCNRGSIDPDAVRGWESDGSVEVWGFVPDIGAVIAVSSIACLPSYREGLPKFLLEAMAAGLPCVATDVPGCREAVRHGDNGLLVPPKDPVALCDALELLLSQPDLAEQMGKRGRQRVAHEFELGLVVDQTLRLYRELREDSRGFSV